MKMWFVWWPRSGALKSKFNRWEAIAGSRVGWLVGWSGLFMRVGPQNCRIFHSWRRNATGVVPDLIPNHPRLPTWIMTLLHCNEIKDVRNFITLFGGWWSTLDLLQGVLWWPVTNFLAPHPRYTFQCSTLPLYTAHKYTVIQAVDNFCNILQD